MKGGEGTPIHVVDCRKKTDLSVKTVGEANVGLPVAEISMLHADKVRREREDQQKAMQQGTWSAGGIFGL